MHTPSLTGTLALHLASVKNICYICRNDMETTETIVIGARVPKSLYDELLVEQKRLEKAADGIKPSINEVVQMLLRKGLEANGKRKR